MSKGRERGTVGLSKVWIDFDEQKYTAEMERTGPDGTDELQEIRVLFSMYYEVRT
ncbi:MAG: hypothetical protein JSV84_10395 [Gemmatimonadota bacterium]|nr:MAG: hypothetical protein JSV84_10395 [Gemmatimonadota bacterium]